MIVSHEKEVAIRRMDVSEKKKKIELQCDSKRQNRDFKKKKKKKKKGKNKRNMLKLHYKVLMSLFYQSE
jgi:hypothetical protein